MKLRDNFQPSQIMRTAIVFVVVTAVCVSHLHGGAENLVKERAKNVRDQNNARQGIPGTPPPATPPPAAAKPAPAKPTPATKIKSNLMNWQAGKTISAESKKSFSSDLLAAARGSRKPSSTTLGKFTDSLATALAGKKPGPSELSRLVENINLSLNSAGLSEERKDEVAAAVRADLESAGASPAEAAAAASDLKAVMKDLNP
jgi:hypothetical protein